MKINVKIEREIIMKKFIKENKYFLTSMLIILVVFNVRLPYYVNTPGGTIDISDRIGYDEFDGYNGSFNMLYVTEYVATIPTYLLSYVINDWDLEKIEESQFSDESIKEIELRNKIMLNNSIQNAIYVAYKRANMNIKTKEVIHYVVGTTYNNGLEIGDQLLQINDKDITDLDMMKKIITEEEIGNSLKFKISRNNKEKELDVEVIDIDGDKGIGVVVLTNYEYETNPRIELKFKASESGSSGGLMLALSIYDAISKEDLLKGRKVAGTGTIDINGNVGEISGIKYKVIGAVNNGMDVVLVPEANYNEAVDVVRKHNYDIDIVKVANFNDAINYLAK